MFSTVKSLFTGLAGVISGPPWTDNFNRANGLVGADWADYDVGGSSGATIVSNALQGPLNGGTGVNAKYLKTSTGVNVGMSVTVKGNFQYTDVGPSSTDPADVLVFQLRAGAGVGDITGYLFNQNDLGVAFYLMDHTGGTVLASSAILTVVNGDVINMEVFGTIVSVYYNDNRIVQANDPSYDLGVGNETSAIKIIRGTSNGTGTSGTPSTFLGIDSYTVYTAVQPALTPAPFTLALTGAAPQIVPPVTFVASSSIYSTTGNNGSIPAHQVGDLIIVWAFRGVSTSAVTMPAGWTSLILGSGTSCSVRCAYKFATSTSDAMGTWSNAYVTMSAIYRNAGTPLQPNGVAAVSSTPSWNTLLQPLRDSNSVLVGFASHRSSNGSLGSQSLSYLSNLRRNQDSGYDTVCYDSIGQNATGFSGVTMSSTGETSSGWITGLIEIPTA